MDQPIQNDQPRLKLPRSGRARKGDGKGQPGGATGKGFQPGRSGNPKGRPKGWIRQWSDLHRVPVQLTALATHGLATPLPPEVAAKLKIFAWAPEPTWAHLFVENVLYRAIVKGDIGFVRELWARTEGQPKEFAESVTDGDGKPREQLGIDRLAAIVRILMDIGVLELVNKDGGNGQGKPTMNADFTKLIEGEREG